MTIAAASALVGYYAGLRHSSREAEPRQVARVVARWSGGEVTEQDLAAHLAQKPVMVRGSYLDAAGRKRLLGEVVETLFLSQEARRRHLDETPRAKLRVAHFLAEELRRAVADGVSTHLSDDEVKRWKEAQGADLTRPGRMRIRTLLLSGSLGEAQALKEELEESHKADPFAFERAARARSAHASRETGGALGFLTREELTRALGVQDVGAVWESSPGTLVGPLQAPQGFHLVLVEARQDAQTISPAVIEKRARQDVLSTRREAALHTLMNRLRDEAGLHVDKARLSAITLTAGYPGSH